MQEWDPYPGDPNSDHLPGAASLRGRSRDLARNAPIATGALNTAVTSTVGTGLRLQSQIDADVLGLEAEDAEAWQRQAERIWKVTKDRLDLEGELSQAATQNLVFRSALESGDVLVIRRYRPMPGDLIGTKVQLVEADRVSNPLWAQDTDRQVAGVALDEDGRVVTYHVSDRHPGDFWTRHSTEWSAVPAWGANGMRLAKLLMDKRRPGQRRGVPYLAPVIEPLKQLERYTHAELMATVVASLFTVFVKTEGGAESGLPSAPPEDIEGGTGPTTTGDVFLHPGAMVDLSPGEDISIADPSRPNAAFDPFVTAVLRQIGVALEIPYEVLVKHFQSSYSAARAALLEAWRFFRGRRAWLSTEFCQLEYEWVISEAVARGFLAAPGFFEDPILRAAWLGSTWIGDPQGHVNPAQEAQAAKVRVDEGFSTIAIEAAQATGEDWELIHRQRAKEQRMRREDGLSSGSAAAPPPTPNEQEEAERQKEQVA